MIGTVLYWIELGRAFKSATTCVQCSVAASFCFPPRAWIEFEEKAWQQAHDWPIDFLTTSHFLSASVSGAYIDTFSFSGRVYCLSLRNSGLITKLGPLLSFLWALLLRSFSAETKPHV